MKENKEIEILLKNLQDGLKTHTVKELNEAITIALNSRHDKKADIDRVLMIVSKHYDIGIKALMSNYGRGKIQDAKQMAYCLLHFNLGLSIRHISKKIFFNWPTSVLIGIKRYKLASPKVKQDVEFIEVYNQLQNELKNYINTKTTEK